MIFHVPFIDSSIKKTTLVQTYIIVVLYIMSLTLTELPLSEQIFFSFLHFNVIYFLKINSIKSIFYLLFGIIHIYFYQSITFMTLIFLVINLFSILAFQVNFVGRNFLLKIPIKTIIFIYIFDLCVFENELKVTNYVFMLIMVVMDYIPNVKIAGITRENILTITYLLVSTAINVVSLYFGIRYGYPSLMSAASISCYNGFSILLTLIADNLSRLQKNKKFSYGYLRIKVLFKYIGSVIIVFSAFCLLNKELQAVLLPSKYTNNPWISTILSGLDFLLTFFGTIYIENISFESFFDSASILFLCDIFISSSAFISSLFDALFRLPQIDSFLALLIVQAIILAIAPEFPELIKILLQSSPYATSVLRKEGVFADVDVSSWCLTRDFCLISIKYPSSSINRLNERMSRIRKLYKEVTLESL